ncbi:MAG: alpha/beta fold hydrolase [Candidatus Dormibacteria bacterium]
MTHVGDIDMYYEIHGSGEPLVLVGGLANDLSEWEWMVNWCAHTHRVLAFDNRGAGRSDKPDAPYSIPMMGNDTDALMDAVGMSHATVIGVSMGGRIALDLALEHPERVGRLILVSTMATARPPGSPTSRMEMLSVAGSLLFRGKHPQPRHAFHRQREASRAYDCTDRLGEIHVPTTILHGRRDRIAPLREAERMRRGIAGSQIVTFGGGHLFFMARERRWFLDSVAAAVAYRPLLTAS